MLGFSGVVRGSRSDIKISDEILSIIPTDPYEQLDLAKKITSMAIVSKVSNLEAEVAELRQKLHEMEMCTHEHDSKASRYGRDFQEAICYIDSRFKILLHDNVSNSVILRAMNMNLTKERDSLATTVMNLNREMAKETESVDIKTYDQSVPVSYPHKDRRTNVHSYSKSVDMMTPPVEEVSKYTGPRFDVSPWITPARTPEIFSPRIYSTAESPKKTTSSQKSSAASSPRGLPLPARTTRIDGKEFFRQVRNRLSYQQFRAFLGNIEELNAEKQTLEETLRRADKILGTVNKDLYLSFQGLLNKNKS